MKMKTMAEIQQMSKEEIAEENNRLAKKLIMRKFVIPVLATVVVHYGVNYLLNKLPDADTTDV